MVMMVPEPALRLGQLIAPCLVFAQFTVFGSPHGLDASRIRCTCFGNTDGPDSGVVHLLDEFDVDRSGLAGPGDREAERRDPPAADKVRGLNRPPFPL